MAELPWFRVYGEEIINDPKLKRIASDIKKPYVYVLGAWTALLALANNSPVRGSLLLTDTMTLTAADISETLHVTLHETQELLHAFQSLKMVSKRGVVNNWAKRQRDSDSSTKRVQKHRAKKRFGNVTVTPQNRTDIEKSRKEQKEGKEQPVGTSTLRAEPQADLTEAKRAWATQAAAIGLKS